MDDKKTKIILKHIENKFNMIYCGCELPRLNFDKIEHFVKIALKEQSIISYEEGFEQGRIFEKKDRDEYFLKLLKDEGCTPERINQWKEKLAEVKQW